MATYAPFLFTSEKELSTKQKWYTMWVNPKSLNYSYNLNTREALTREGYQWQHWQSQLTRLSFVGVTGNLFPHFNDYSPHPIPKSVGANPIDKLRLLGTTSKKTWESQFAELAIRPGGYTTKEIENTNHPRLFAARLQTVALQEKFYHDTTKGYRVYNSKRLTIFTKTHPDGVSLVGVFNKFIITEEALDTQQISYECEFIVQKGLSVELENELDSLTPQIDIEAKYNARVNS